MKPSAAHVIPTDVFDPLSFSQTIKSSAAPIPIIKRYIERTTDFLHQQFHSNQFHIRELIWARAWFIDNLLQAIWHKYHWDNDICLAAVGGYGRGELHPYSDIDLLILAKDEQAIDRYQEQISAFVTLLWDIKLDIGHSVRTEEQCISEADKEITVATNLMEARCIAGHSNLLAKTITRVENETWPSPDFFKAKWDEQINRHEKLGNSEYNLEPNIKSSPGGLRDIQMIGWIAKRHFGADSFEELAELGFLTEKELSILNEGLDYLWRIRYWLHMLSNREEDRLLFDHQRTLSKMHGYEDDDARLAVERFMQEYYRWAFGLGQLNDLLIQHFDQMILRACDAEELISINPRFNVRNGLIEVKNNKIFEKTPSALLEIFVHMAQNPAIDGTRAATIRLIRESQHLIDDEFRKDPRNARFFMEVLRSPQKVALQLRRMLRFGVLGNYLPEFAAITGQMQHDLFHIYSVDAHTMEVVKNLRRFSYTSYQEKFPLAFRIMEHTEDRELLYIAALYHDIAKGRGGDHSELGVKDAALFCEQHKLKKSETQLICWLVRHHLLMSSVAQRKDISDPDVISDFAKVIGDETRLNSLYLLTVADINGTNPSLWNSWRDSLLRQLYNETKRALRRGLENPIDKQDRIDDKQKGAIERLINKGFTLEKINKHWGELNEEYFLREKVVDIIWHTKSIAKHTDTEKPLVLLKESSDLATRGATQIFIYTKDKPSVFALVTSTLEHLNLTIVDARLYDFGNGHTLDIFYVLDANKQSIELDKQRIELIQKTLSEELLLEDFHSEVKKRTPRQLRLFSIPTTTEMHNHETLNCSVLEVITPDRPGLLARIASIFIDHNIHLKNAKITTLGERVEDVFFITDKDGNAIDNIDDRITLQAAICKELDQQNSAKQL